jgi:hypothetical protein
MTSEDEARRLFGDFVEELATAGEEPAAAGVLPYPGRIDVELMMQAAGYRPTVFLVEDESLPARDDDGRDICYFAVRGPWFFVEYNPEHEERLLAAFEGASVAPVLLSHDEWGALWQMVMRKELDEPAGTQQWRLPVQHIAVISK